jgi:hypothetical protein
MGVPKLCGWGLELKNLSEHIGISTLPCAHISERSMLSAQVQKLGPRPTAAQRASILDKRKALAARIRAHHQRLESLLPSLPSILVELPGDLPEEGEDSTEGNKEPDEDLEDMPDEDLPEFTRVKMPSSFGATLVDDPHHLAEQERELRTSQAYEALEALQRSLGEASVMYKLQSRQARRGKNTRTRSYDQAKLALGQAHKHWKIYNRARQALLHLPGSEESKEIFQVINASDLKPSPDIYHENRVGQRSAELPWFWKMSGASKGSGKAKANWQQECECRLFFSEKMDLAYFAVERVHWLRAKARLDRWTEELCKVQNEMCWTVLGFYSRAVQWETWAEEAVEAGPSAYASKQRALWTSLAEQAKTKFTASVELHLKDHPDWIEQVEWS